MPACPRCREGNAATARFCTACGTPLTVSPPPVPAPTRRDDDPRLPPPPRRPAGPRLPPRYTVLRPLGAGAMGQVFLCHDAELQVEVAVKILPPDLEEEPRSIAKLKEEARRAARLRGHPGILDLYEFASWSGSHYLVMEFAEGGSLDKRVERDGALPEAECRRIGAEVADALAHAHSLRLLHRDIKPANILLDGRGAAKVGDFGIGKVHAEVTARRSAMTIAGSPAYMAPEIVRQEKADFRADLYSLGSTLFEMATGKVPYSGRTVDVLLAKSRPVAPPLDPRGHRPDLSPGFAAVVSRLTERAPARRFADAGSVAAVLRVKDSGGPPGDTVRVVPPPRRR